MEEGGFKVVRRKRKANHQSVPISCHAISSDSESIENSPLNIDLIISNITNCQEELKNSELYGSVSSTLRYSLKRFHEENASETAPLAKLVCYGLGNFSSCVIARYQLALFLCLKQDLMAEVSLFDPAFSLEEKAMLLRLECGVIAQNEEGKHQVDAPTLFYMPHCAKELYNNLLWANWSPSLSKLVILGNSFSHMMDSLPLRQFHNNWNYISKAGPLVEEYGVKNCFRFNDIFNDTAVHIFPKTKMQRLHEQFWLEHEEPVYQDNSC